jgi:transposase
VILDNYQIHCSRQTRAWLAEFGKRIWLHFLPPYYPDDNRIERKVWRELHANLTRNHDFRTIEVDERGRSLPSVPKPHRQTRLAQVRAKSFTAV